MTEKFTSYIKERRFWLSKYDIHVCVEISDAQWGTEISDLIARDIIQRKGGGVRYRIIESR